MTPPALLICAPSRPEERHDRAHAKAGIVFENRWRSTKSPAHTAQKWGLGRICRLEGLTQFVDPERGRRIRARDFSCVPRS